LIIRGVKASLYGWDVLSVTQTRVSKLRRINGLKFLQAMDAYDTKHYDKKILT